MGLRVKNMHRLNVAKSPLSSLGVYSGHLTVPLDAFAAGLGDHTIVSTLCPGGKERMGRLLSIVAAKRFPFGELTTHSFITATTMCSNGG